VTQAAAFERSVFLNCPFDEEYRPLLRAQLFTILACGLVPRLASERADTGEVRLGKILDLVASCRFSIHDLSRSEPLKPGDLPRFNMPFELGLDLGCRHFGVKQAAEKKFLVLEKERYRYQRVLSDLAGCDIRAHDNSPETLVQQVRAWLYVTTRLPQPSGGQIWEWLNLFEVGLSTQLAQLRYSASEVHNLEVAEYVAFVERWLKSTKVAKPRASTGGRHKVRIV
jgi:hypothetical protein